MKGAKLLNRAFSFKLFDQLHTQNINEIKRLINSGDTLSSASLGSAFITGAILLNPTIIFNLINLVEMFSYILLFDIEFHKSFIEFMIGLKTKTKFPGLNLPIVSQGKNFQINIFYMQ